MDQRPDPKRVEFSKACKTNPNSVARVFTNSNPNFNSYSFTHTCTGCQTH